MRLITLEDDKDVEQVETDADKTNDTESRYVGLLAQVLALYVF